MIKAGGNMRKTATLGLVEISWRWKVSEGGPLLEGYIGREEDGLTFSLGQAITQKGFLLKVADGTQSLELTLLQAAQNTWQFQARHGQATGFAQRGWKALLAIPREAVTPGSNGELALPFPWQGKWSLWRRGQATPVLDLQLWTPGLHLETASLGGSNTEWATNLPKPFGSFECAYMLEIGRDGAYTCTANLPELPGSVTIRQLDEWPDAAPPLPPPAPEAPTLVQQQNQLQGLAPFRQLGLLTLLVPPGTGSPRPPALLRLFALANDTPYYQQLLTTATQDSLAALQQLANAFLAGQAPWAEQYVSDLAALPEPFAHLACPAAEALLCQPMADRAELTVALTQLFDMPAQQLPAQPSFAEQSARIANSYLTLLVLDYSQAAALGQLNRALRVLALVRWLDTEPQALATAAQITQAQQARPLLATQLFPLPQGPHTQAPPGWILGAGRLYQFAERECGHALGPVAETVNLLAGERQGNRLNRKTSVTDHRLDAGQAHSLREQRGVVGQQVLEQPLLANRTQYNDLAEQYGQDGLSLTVSGNCIVAPGTLDGTDFQPVQQARTEAQNRLEGALNQVQQKVRSQRELLLRSSWESSQWQRLDNPGELPRQGFFHWLLELRDARLRDLGAHLLYHWTLPAPGQALLTCLNAQRGLRMTIPAPPWQPAGDVPGVSCAAELNQDNYLALARRYSVQPLLTAPQETRVVTQELSASGAPVNGVLSVPFGHVSRSLDYATPAGSSGSLLIAGKALDLAAQQTVELPGLDGDVSFTLAVTSGELAVSLRLTCAELHYASHLADWQQRAYQQLQECYRQALADLAAVLQQFCAEQPGGFAECLVNLLHGAILQAAQSHYPDTQGLGVRRAQQLQPWLRRALPWQQAVLACTSEQQPADWLPLSGKLDGALAGIDLLLASQLRMTLPLDNASAARLFYVLRSGGRLWLGDEAQVPVFAEDAELYNLWQDLRNEPAAPDQCWRFSVETCHRYLSDNLELKPPCSSQ